MFPTAPTPGEGRKSREAVTYDGIIDGKPTRITTYEHNLGFARRLERKLGGEWTLIPSEEHQGVLAKVALALTRPPWIGKPLPAKKRPFLAQFFRDMAGLK